MKNRKKIVEDMSNRQKDGYFQCTTCNKKCFTKIAFEKHLINEHSLILQIEKDKVVNKDSISHQDCIPHLLPVYSSLLLLLAHNM